jgi:hypothetical protein
MKMGPETLSFRVATRQSIFAVIFLVDPHVLPRWLTGNEQRDFLENELPRLVGDVACRWRSGNARASCVALRHVLVLSREVS